MVEGFGHIITLTTREPPFHLVCHCVNNYTYSPNSYILRRHIVHMQEMALPCKSKVLLKLHEYDSNEIVEFSSFSLSACLSYSNHIHSSPSSDFNKFSFQETSPSSAKSTANFANFGDSTHTSNDNRILIVDDEEDIARLFKVALEQSGFMVDIYNDPLLSLSNYRAGIYDLLLLDIRMPQMNGLELYKRIRQIDDNAKVCFMTAFEVYHDEFKSIFPDLIEKGCFIRKPIGMDALIRTVKSHLNYN
jgi:CheY-like chemotaxis protein